MADPALVPLGKGSWPPPTPPPPLTHADATGSDRSPSATEMDAGGSSARREGGSPPATDSQPTRGSPGAATRERAPDPPGRTHPVNAPMG